MFSDDGAAPAFRSLAPTSTARATTSLPRSAARRGSAPAPAPAAALGQDGRQARRGRHRHLPAPGHHVLQRDPHRRRAAAARHARAVPAQEEERRLLRRVGDRRGRHADRRRAGPHGRRAGRRVRRPARRRGGRAAGARQRAVHLAFPTHLAARRRAAVFADVSQVQGACRKLRTSRCASPSRGASRSTARCWTLVAS